ncbi:fibropellin-1-like [Branchiostoma floridae]|uniref:Fibropellin-1-like n=1 Tax=Branchiostoma floridae TaxID=7739 RepID=A0A9J7KY43_BRAFL|nr:fibropellin-1-like [Branchiostoma floridae]
MMQTYRRIVLLLWGVLAVQLMSHQAAAEAPPDSDTNFTPDEAAAARSGGESEAEDPDSTVDTAEGAKPAAFEKGDLDSLQLGEPVDGDAVSAGNRAAPAGHKLILVADATDRTITRLTTDDDNQFQWGRYDIGNGTNRPIAVDYDRAEDFIYWTSVNGPYSRVSRFPYESGSGLRLDGGQASVPDGIAVDVISRNLYWTDAGTDRIIVSRLDGSFRKSLITQGLDEPRAIVVDPNSGWMYWTDWGNPSKIERARMDGTQRSVIINIGQGHWPNGLALDAAANRLYWCHGGTGAIWTSGVTGSNPSPTQLFTQSAGDVNAHLFGIAVDETHLYWTAWNIPGVHRISKSLTGYVRLNLPHFQKLYDIHVRTDSNTPSQPNACSVSNGNCAQLCLPVPGGGRTCACQDGWSLGSDGRSCQADACHPNPCLNGGACDGVSRRTSLSCSNNVCVSGFTHTYTCDCPAGFSGDKCEINENECVSNPCQNGGQCQDEANSYSCTCAAGYSGDDCETNDDDCAPNPCQNGGQCQDGVNSYTCTCAAGYSGDDCETNDDDCAPNPCQNGGQCQDGVNSYTCNCAAGYSGDDCETNDDDCEPNPCQNGGQCQDGVNSYTCNCPAGYSGDDCETNDDDCAPNPCQNGGQCQDGVNSYTCNCPAGYSGDDCETNDDDCAPNPCQNGGQCQDGVNSYTCNCPAGYSGDDCETNDDDCAPNPCQNGGQCQDGVNSYTCNCPAGYSGDDCETNDDDCAPNPCQNGGQCQDGVNSYTCNCPAGYSGDDCETNDDDCAPNPCQNGGQCQDGVNSYTCNCPAGYSGDDCETNDDDCAPNPCQNGGQCQDGVNSYTCNCPAGYSGDDCETNDDDCAPNPCQNGGQCQDGVNSYTCTCAAGYSGDDCEINDNDCNPNPCQNGGQCQDGVNSYTCDCPDGFNGFNCQTNINECASRPCQNGGQCQDGVNSYTCDCPDGYLGEHCEISATDPPQTTPQGTSTVCESGWFHHEGKCYCLLDDQSTYSEAARSCAELDVYGQLAVVKRPSTHRFLMDYVEREGGGSPWIGINDGTTEGVWRYSNGDLVSDPFNEWADGTWNSRKKDCVRMSETFGYHWQPMPCDTQLSYICEYPLLPPTDAPTPTTPDVERCEPDTCNQGGICIDGPSSYTCYCLPGFTGDHCETETDECDPNPCQNGGVCTDGQLSYTCRCPSGFGGVNCQLTCPAGFTLFQKQCYWFSPTSMRETVANAETDCDARGARLACVKDEDTHNFLKLTIATTNRRPYWIGLNDTVVEDVWRHSDGTLLGSFRPFRPSRNTNNVWRDCVLMWPASSYQWLYYNCNSRRNYVCQRAATP